MVTKVKAVSLAAVKVGGPVVLGTQGLTPCCSDITKELSLCGRGGSPLLTEGRGKEEEKMTGLPFEEKDPEVTHLISTHIPLARRIQSFKYMSPQGSWEMQSYIWAGIWPDKTSLTME